MPPRCLALIPLKPFHRAKERLDLAPQVRAAFAEATASVVAAACTNAGLHLAVVTADPGVAAWAAARDATVIEDPGGGLNAAAAVGVTVALDRGLPWLMVHGDLPLLRSDDLAGVAEVLSAGVTVLAPSTDGGTNLLGSARRLPLRYGVGSFVRHLAAAASAPRLVITRRGTAVEVDTVEDLRTASLLPEGSWLQHFLT